MAKHKLNQIQRNAKYNNENIHITEHEHNKSIW